MSKYPQLSEFSLAFADAYRGFMKEYRVTGQGLTNKLGRALGYVSERVNGKRALDTEDVDALAMLAGDGWTGRTLMIELSRRARETMVIDDANVGGRVEDDIPHLGKVDLDGLTLAADARGGVEAEQEQSQELP